MADASRVIPANEYRRVRWKNGTGWTREIARMPDREDWDWRLSIAEIEQDGPFSVFPGIERELVLIRGNGLRLRFEDGEVRELQPPHERIRFEALKKEDHPIMAQLLLAPVSAELSREEAAAVLENRALLERCGFEAEDFGGGDVLIRQIPSDVDVEDAKALLQELAGKLLAGKTLDPNGLRDELLHSIACKSAIKAGWQTSDEELRRLVQEVLTRDDIKYCPHGRPVCVTLTKRQLEKQFKRV